MSSPNNNKKSNPFDPYASEGGGGDSSSNATGSRQQQQRDGGPLPPVPATVSVGTGPGTQPTPLAIGDNGGNSNEPVDTAGANAEAARLARELGVASSGQRRAAAASAMSSSGGSRWPFLRRNSNAAAPTSSTGAAGQAPSSVASSFSYLRMRDNNGNPIPAVPNNLNASNAGDSDAGNSMGSRPSATASAVVLDDVDTCPSYAPPTTAVLGPGAGDPVVGSTSSQASGTQSQTSPPAHPDHEHQPSNEPIHLYDIHGQRVPYKEGPYFIAREKCGKVVKKRWCE